MHKFDRRLERLAMVMPLTSEFDPGVTQFAHEHLQVCIRSVGDEWRVRASWQVQITCDVLSIPSVIFMCCS